MQGPDTQPMVAVWMVTYNHEAYIAQAIEGVLMQQTNFAVQLFIGDDASTDATTSICKAYQEKHPEKITLLQHPENIGSIQNAKSVYEACLNSGAKYMAMCEGDDYWTNTQKLQKQVDLLEAHPQYSLCFHDAWLLMNKSGTMHEYAAYPQDTYDTVAVLIKGAFIPTLSIVCRVEGLNFPNWFSRTSIGDIAFVLMNSLQGDIILLREKMGVYRKHEKGVSVEMEANQIQLSLESVKLLHYFNLHTQFEYDHIIQEVNKATLYRMKHFVAYQNTSDTRPLRQKLVSPDFWRRKIRELIS